MNKDVVSALVDEVLDYPDHTALWLAALERLKDRCQLDKSVDDIKPLVLEVVDDWENCNTDWLKERLFTMFYPHVRKSLVRGLAVWYQKKLLEPVAPEPEVDLTAVDLGESGA